MKLELKNIKINQALSEETFCYSASLYKDGKKVAVVTNHGFGGPDELIPAKGRTRDQFQTDISEIEEWLAKNNPPAFHFNDEAFPYTLEMWCGDQCNNKQISDEYRRITKSKLLFIHNNKVMQIGLKKVRTLSPAHISYLLTAVKSKYGEGIKVLNEMPEDEALKLYVSGS